jgi:hypothetical protein
VVTTIYGSYHLKFDGTRQTTGGTAQNLIEWHVIEDTLTFPPQAAPVMPLRIATDMPRGPQFIGNPVFIQGGAWMKTGNRIIKYGDIGAVPSWQFLTEDLDPGDEFEFQLGAGLIDGVYLYCRVDKEMTVENQAGRFAKAIDCLYIIDYGVSRLTDVQGNPIGYFRNVDIGRVIYAPTVGPVLCYERLGIQPEEKSSLGLADVTVDLYDSSTLE